MHELTYDTIKEFGLFEHRFLDYIKRWGEDQGGSNKSKAQGNRG